MTGQDSEVESVKSIMAGEQYSTINKDTSLLVEQNIKMIGQLQKGEEVDVNDTEQYDNGVKVVPAYLLPPVIVTKENAAEPYANNPTLLDIGGRPRSKQPTPTPRRPPLLERGPSSFALRVCQPRSAVARSTIE